MSQKIYVVDAFTDSIFSGNPAAVCPLEKWLPDQVMQNIAMENNLAETAFFVRSGDVFQIRWFTPVLEVDLCGHATLASAYVLFLYEGYYGETIQFHSARSGVLSVSRSGDVLTMNFPADVFEEIPLDDRLLRCFEIAPQKAFLGKTDYMLVFQSEEQIKNIIPNMSNISALGLRGVIITAMGKDVDFVSRFFAPQSGINEDPVTGSAHTTLTPYWSKVLGKETMTAMQLSARKGHVQCTLLGDRVEISGKAKLYMQGIIHL